MQSSHDAIIYAVVLVLSFAAFYGFLKIGVAKIARSVIVRPVLVIGLCLIIVSVLGIGMKNLAFDSDAKMLLPEKVPARVVLKKIYDVFGGIDTVYISVTAKKGTIWDPHILTQVRAITRVLGSAPYADNVISITESKSISNKVRRNA